MHRSILGKFGLADTALGAKDVFSGQVVIDQKPRSTENNHSEGHDSATAL